MSGFHSRLFALALLACTAMVLAEPAFAQSNNNDYTPLNSRIRRDRPLPLEPRNIWDPAQVSQLNRERSRDMISQFSRCMWNRSNEDSLDLLARTDFGFVAFDQIGLDGARAAEIYPIETCLTRVANTNNSGVRLSFNASSMRRWLLQEAYFASNSDSATWIVAGNVEGERSYPLSANNPGVTAAMDFADCVVAADPYSADYFFRTLASTDEERSAVSQLMPVVSGCIPQGQEIEMTRTSLRVWIGEALWHASQHSAAASVEVPSETSQEAQ